MSRRPHAAAMRRPLGRRVDEFLRDWSLPRQLAGRADAVARRPRAALSRGAAAAARAGRHGRHQHLPVLRGRLRPAGLRQERQAHPHRGRPAQPDQPGHALPEGRGHLRLADQPAPADHGASTARPTPTTGRRGRSTGRWSASPSSSSRRATRPSSETLPDGTTVNHTLAIGSLGGATLDNEENYLIKKLFGGGLGMVWIENQARI